MSRDGDGRFHGSSTGNRKVPVWKNGRSVQETKARESQASRQSQYPNKTELHRGAGPFSP